MNRLSPRHFPPDPSHPEAVRVRFRRCLRLMCAAWVLFAGLAWMPATAATAQDGTAVGEYQVVQLPSDFAPPAGAQQLPDLVGPGFLVSTVQGGFSSALDTSQGQYTPADIGDELLYVISDTYLFHLPFYQPGASGGPFTLSVTSAGHAVALPLSLRGSISGVAGSAYGDEGTSYPGAWAVAVPKAVALDLVATSSGFSQTVDLRSGARVGLAPEVLYRSAAGPLALDVRPNSAATLVVAAGADRISFPVTLQEATLSYFDLTDPSYPSGLDPGSAYLFVRFSVGVGTDQAGRAQWYYVPSVPSSAASLQILGQSPVAARIAPAAGDPTDTGTLFNGIFGFVVPGGLTQAQVVLSTGPNPVVYRYGPNDYTPAAVAASSVRAANFAVSFPPPAPVGTSTAPPAPAASVPIPTPTSTSASSPLGSSGGMSVPAAGKGEAHGSSGTDFWPWLVVGLGGGLTLLLVGGFFVSRRTLVEPTPVKPATDPDADGETDNLGRIEDTTGPGHAQPAWLETAGTPPAVIGGLLVDRPATAGVDAVLTPNAPEGSADETIPSGAPDAALVVAGVVAAEDPVGMPGPTPADDLPALRVRLLGRLEVEGTVEAIGRRLMLRALVVLALNHGRPLSGEELRFNLAQAENKEPSSSSLQSELSRLRRALPEGLLPESNAGTGYFLAGRVEVDWTDFTRLVRHFNQVQDARRLEVALAAMALVRGPVLVHQAWHGIDARVWEMTAEIERFAVHAGGVALKADRCAAAAQIARQALLALPGSPALWQLRIRAGEAGSGEDPRALDDRARKEVGPGFEVGAE